MSPTKRVINPSPGAASGAARPAPAPAGTKSIAAAGGTKAIGAGTKVIGAGGTKAIGAGTKATARSTKSLGQTPVNVRLLALVVGGAALLALIIVAAVLFVRSRDRVQVPALFARIEEAVKNKDAAAFVANISPEFDFNAKWPSIFPSKTKSQQRALATQLIGQALQLGGSNGVTMEWSVDEYERQEDGTVKVIFTGALSGGLFGTLLPGKLERHEFILAKEEGWSFAYQVADTEKFNLAMPDKKAVKAARSKLK